MDVFECVGGGGAAHIGGSPIAHPSIGSEEGGTEPLNCPSSKAEAGCYGDVLCFPTVWLHLTSTKS